MMRTDYTVAPQLASTERAIKVIQAMPKETRDMAAMVASAFVEGMLAGQRLGAQKPDPDKKPA